MPKTEEELALEEVGKLSAETYCNIAESSIPKIFAKLYPRRIIAPQGYYPSKYYAATNALGVEQLTIGNCMQLSEIDKAIAVQAIICQEYKVPMYYLDRNLGEALLNSKVPQGTTVADLPKTRVSGVINLPKNFLISPEGEPIAYIAYSFVFADVISDIYAKYKIQFTGNNCILMSSAVASGPKLMYGLSVETHKTIKDIDENREYMLGTGISVPILADEDDNRFSAKCFNLLCNVLFLIESRPDILQKQTLHGKGKYKKDKNKKSTDELWAPRWIGYNYKSPNDGNPASPRMHWRQGHWRNQPCGGKDNPQIKRIWIDTVLICAPA